jgi:hypothetical protein
MKRVFLASLAAAALGTATLGLAATTTTSHSTRAPDRSTCGVFEIDRPPKLDLFPPLWVEIRSDTLHIEPGGERRVRFIGVTRSFALLLKTDTSLEVEVQAPLGDMSTVLTQHGFSLGQHFPGREPFFVLALRLEVRIRNTSSTPARITLEVIFSRQL